MANHRNTVYEAIKASVEQLPFRLNEEDVTIFTEHAYKVFLDGYECGKRLGNKKRI